MKVIFARNNSIASILIRLVTWSRLHHCGALTSDGKSIIEATTFGGVVKTPLADFLKRYKKTETVEITCNDREARVFLYDQVGKKSGNYEVRVPLLDADFAVELI